MSEQIAIAIAAATVGFVAAVFFCIGNIINTSKSIYNQSIPYWDFSEPVARALTAQRAQYIVGALLLVVAFLLQVVATLSSSTTPAALPRWLQALPYLILAVLAPVLLIGFFVVWLIYKLTIQKVLCIVAADIEDEKKRLANKQNQS